MLSEAQQSAARYHGATELTSRRSHLRRLRTSLIEVRGSSAMVDDDHATLGKACRVLDRLLQALEADINEAKRIKRDWDQRVTAATAALLAIPLAGVADVIALAELDHSVGRPHALLEDIAYSGWNAMGESLRREAINGLASRCASSTTPASEFVAAVRDAMPLAAAKHAELVQQINTLAVAQSLERTTRQPAGGL